MTYTTRAAAFIIAVCATGPAGCSQMQLVFHQPKAISRAPQVAATSRIMLAAHGPGSAGVHDGAVSQSSATQSQPEEMIETRQGPEPGREPTDASQPPGETATSVPATQPGQEPPYTSPGDAFKELAFGDASAAFVAIPAMLGEGKAAAESLILTPEGILGRARLTAPTTVAANVIVSRPGLVTGPATGLSFASRQNNIFRPTFNPLSGPNGRCRELAAAGFFGGSQKACEGRTRR